MENNTENNLENEEELDDVVDDEETNDGTAQPGEDDNSEETDETLTNEEVDKIVEKRLKRERRKHRQELAKLKSSADNEDLSEFDQVKKELDQLKAEKVKTEREREVRNTFQAADFTPSDELVSLIAHEDEDVTADVSDAIVELVRQEVQKVKKEQARRNPPANADDGNSDEMNLGQRLGKGSTASSIKPFE